MTDTPVTEDEWRAKLSPEQFHVLREAGTEPAWSGELLAEKRDGTFACGACGQQLFSSSTGSRYQATGSPGFALWGNHSGPELVWKSPSVQFE